MHDGILMRIDLRDGSIPTDQGIRIGDPGAAALAAYPDAAVVDEWGTDVLVVPGEHGVLHIEIARERDGGPRRILGRPGRQGRLHPRRGPRRRGVHGRREREHRGRLPLATPAPTPESSVRTTSTALAAP